MKAWNVIDTRTGEIDSTWIMYKTNADKRAKSLNQIFGNDRFVVVESV